jgi:hypothetical protein
LSGSPSEASNWVYRIFDRRTISVRAKNEQVRKLAVVDLVTNLPFAIEVPSGINLETLEVGKEYLAAVKVYTAQEIKDVPAEFAEFLKVVDVDRSIDEFIKAYWLYPKTIKFELTETETI